MEKEKTAITPHQVILQDRERLELTGVSDVDGFDDATVTAVTPLGDLAIRGENLQVERLDLDAGILSVSGQIDSLQYSRHIGRERGFLGRLFR